MAGVFSNNIQLGVPIAISLLGKGSLPSIAVIFSLNGFLMWTLATIAIELGRNGYQIRDYQLTITGGKDIDFSPIRVVCCKHQEFNAKAEEAVTGDLRIIPMGNTFIVELTYRVGKDECKNSRSVALNPNEALCCDLGIDNFATFVSTKPGIRPFLVKGKILKSINQQYNKQVAELRSKKHYEHIRIKGVKRYCQLQDLMHKASRLAVNFCLAHDLGRIVIGTNRNWKQSVNLGKRNNQNFVMLPHAKFIEMVRYKAEEYGIQVTVREESYTSKASALDMDVIADFDPKQGKTKPVFSGKRIKRGLYRSSDGHLINADINGAANIGRKELGDEWLKKLLELDGGVFVDTPAIVRNLHACAGVRQLLEMGARSHETSHVSAR
ncbi:IS200/IS605 family accessory protein TnpB-related protein [uncultured Parasutterella sp.]|uniref:RNA-guided endonuclease InsQ/TnpB family protein n=1 Tax=uncultured Parasutterella sp. TaxID=1263098 RepID=UPI0025B6E426|nr:IS200/IS605 family accessory protein TnpB-related protein [uncultured Parasutterella sp.]